MFFGLYSKKQLKKRSQHSQYDRRLRVHMSYHNWTKKKRAPPVNKIRVLHHFQLRYSVHSPRVRILIVSSIKFRVAFSAL